MKASHSDRHNCGLCACQPATSAIAASAWRFSLRLWVASVEMAWDVALAAVVVVPEAALALVNVRILPHLDVGRVLREEHVMHLVVHAVGEAQVLAHVLPEGHGVTRD